MVAELVAALDARVAVVESALNNMAGRITNIETTLTADDTQSQLNALRAEHVALLAKLTTFEGGLAAERAKLKKPLSRAGVVCGGVPRGWYPWKS